METNQFEIYHSLEKKNDLHNIGFASQEKNKAFILFQKVQGAMRYVPDFGETCKAILEAVMDGMEAENCSLMLKDPVSGDLTIRAARGKEEKRSAFYKDSSNNGRRFKSGEGIAGQVLKEGIAVLLNDVNQEPHFVKTDGLNKVRSLICYPIREKDQVVGVFNLSHSQRGAFSEGDKLALSYISNQLGAALTSTRFFLEMKEVNRLVRETGSTSGQEKSLDHTPSTSSTFIEVGEITPENGMFIYASKKMHRIKAIIDQVSNTDVTVLIQGESGVGKEVVAHSVHLNSYRRDKPFVKVNCAALPSELLESELFGYEKGAFTGAYRHKPGKFELANSGTIFLDEISEMSLSLQGKLLQVLQDREFSRLGGKKDIRVDVRVLVATNRNIEEAVNQGRFREDLYYRLNVVNITIPPLRERKEEIPVFVEYFIDKFTKKYHKKIKPLSNKTMKMIYQHYWLGNVRELENVIQRLVVLGNERMIIDELSQNINKVKIKNEKKAVLNKKTRPSLKEIHRGAMTRAEAEVIQNTLEKVNWNRKKAASLLNISYKTLLYKIKEYGLKRDLNF